MSVFGVKLPDVGEGVAEAELIEWYVAVGDEVTPETVLADVMTDKATVEISSPVAGVVTFLVGEPGDTMAVGTEFVGIETDDPVPSSSDARATPTDADAPAGQAAEPGPAEVVEVAAVGAPSELPGKRASSPAGGDRSRATASPAVRARAKALGMDLASLSGSGPGGQVEHADLDRLLLGGAPPSPGIAKESGQESGPDSGRTTTETVRGLRRRIAERLTASWTEIPHITYVDAVDVTDVEALRTELNRRGDDPGTRLSILTFIARAVVIACADEPRLNARFDAEAGTVTMFDDVELGIATQTDDGLMVPVVHRANRLGLRELAAEIARLAAAARAGTATRDELTGSTITITSLGAIGGLVTTPIINQPEVAIIGVNKLERRPVWRNGAFEPRDVVNLSSSFDHRVIDGWDAATFVQRVKSLLEMPALLFVDGETLDSRAH